MAGPSSAAGLVCGVTLGKLLPFSGPHYSLCKKQGLDHLSPGVPLALTVGDFSSLYSAVAFREAEAWAKAAPQLAFPLAHAKAVP